MLIGITTSMIGLEEHRARFWSIMLPVGFEYASLFRQETWRHIAAQIKQGDIITVRTEDHALYARLYVRASDRQWAQVSEIEKIVFDDGSKAEAENDSGYDIRYSGGSRFGVYRKADNARIIDKFQTRELAAAWLDNHLKQIAA